MFSDEVVRLVRDLNAVDLSETESLSIEVPLAPFDGLTVDQAIKEDAPGWH